MAQKLVATGELVMPDGDIFEATDKARSARSVLEQAQKEIQKTFPDFKFAFSVAQVRAAGSKPPGRKPGSGANAPPPGNGAGAGATA